MSLLNPHAKLTPVPLSSATSASAPSISNTSASPTISHIGADLAYLARLGPGPLPWEARPGTYVEPPRKPMSG